MVADELARELRVWIGSAIVLMGTRDVDICVRVVDIGVGGGG